MYIVITASLFYALSNDFIINELCTAYEHPATSRRKLEMHDIGIILTGGLMNEEKEPVDNLFLGSHADRFAQAILLYKEKKIKKILISGGDLKLISRPIKSEGKLVAEFMIKCGVNPADIILENKSVNTYQNAKFTAELVRKKYPEQRLILLTSASHLPRAIACFEKQHLPVTPYGTDYMSKKRGFLWIQLIPSGYALEDAQTLLHEWIGYLTYKVMGYC
jgi:uncharacterized SAM-binding protein YcdF (DUF218 family)